MVFIPFYQILDPIQMSLKPYRIFREKLFFIAHPMRLDVRLSDDIEPEFITKFHERGIIRIVRGSHCIDVASLHLQEIRSDVVLGDVVAGFRIVVMTIDSLDQDRLAVDEELAVLHLRPAKAGLSPISGDLAAGGIGECDLIGIEIGDFCRPRFHTRDINHRSSLLDGLARRNLDHYGRHRNHVAVSRSESEICIRRNFSISTIGDSSNKS